MARELVEQRKHEQKTAASSSVGKVTLGCRSAPAEWLPGHAPCPAGPQSPHRGRYGWGWPSVPEARELVEQRKHEQKTAASSSVGKVTLEDLFSQIQAGEMKQPATIPTPVMRNTFRTSARPRSTSRNLGASIQLNYYRQVVDELGYPMRPFRYEVSLENKEKDLENPGTSQR